MESPCADADYKPERRGILVVLASEPNAASLLEQGRALALSIAAPLFVVRTQPAAPVGLRSLRQAGPRTACAQTADVRLAVVAYRRVPLQSVIGSA